MKSNNESSKVPLKRCWRFISEEGAKAHSVPFYDDKMNEEELLLQEICPKGGTLNV